MKSTVIALLATSAQAQAPAGTAAIAGGNLDADGYTWLTETLPAVGLTECDVDADCNNVAENIEGNSCSAIVMSDGAYADQGYCTATTNCGDDKEDAINVDAQGVATESAETYGFECNDATTEATGEDMDIMDFMYWDAWTSALSACTADADCTATGSACGDVTQGGMTVKMCVDIDGWCNTKDDSSCDSDSDDTKAAGGCAYSAGGSWDVYGTTGKFTTACAGDASADWLWWRNQSVTQDVGACDSSKEDFDATTMECASGTTCGTATLGKDTMIGCWADADCTALKGTVTDSATEYTLLCGATKLFAATAAALAVAASI